MNKNAVIALVIGLIIGGLAVWLIMGFTTTGQTMILRTAVNTTPTPTATPRTTAISGAYDYTTDPVEIGGIQTADGKTYSMTFTASGVVLTKDTQKVARVDLINITNISADLATDVKALGTLSDSASTTAVKDKKITGTTFDAINSLANTDKSDTGTGAAKDTAATKFVNLGGDTGVSLANLKKAFEAAQRFKTAMSKAAGTDSFYFADNMQITWSSSVLAMLDDGSVKDAGFWGEMGGAFRHLCNALISPFEEFYHGWTGR